MKAIIPLALAATLSLTSCSTPEGTGALAGAGAGALIGGLAGGHGRDAALGAAIGGASGALLGNVLGRPHPRYVEHHYYHARYMPYGTYVGRGLVRSPYSPHTLVDVGGMPRGAVVEDPVTGGRFVNP